MEGRMKTVALVGRSELSYRLAPYNDPTVHIWSLKDLLSSKFIPRADAMFEMHNPDKWGKAEHFYNDPLYLDWLYAPHDFPIYMNKYYSDIPACSEYPLAAIKTRYLRHVWHGPHSLRHFFCDTPSYMFALAIVGGYTRIEFYGIEMASISEYRYQRDCFHFWAGVASTLGIDVVVPEVSALFDTELYGYGWK